MEGYSFCILDTIRNKYVAIKHSKFDSETTDENYLDRIKEVIRSDKHFNKRYKSSNFINITKKSTLIPDSYFDKKKLKTYFEFNHTLDDFEEIHFNQLKQVTLLLH